MKKVEIWRDEAPCNPFTEWDCEPPLMWESGRYNGEDYSQGEIKRFIANFPTDNQIIRHQKVLVDLFCIDLQYFKDYYFTRDQKAAEIRDSIFDADYTQLSQVCDLFKIPHLKSTSRGYSQSDWADVFILLTDEFFETTGCDRKNSKEILEGTEKLFDAYMWGNVYGFTVYEGKEMVKLSRKDFESGNCDNVSEEIEWEEVDSCGGFYGHNFLTNGILDHLDTELHEQVLASDEHCIY
jgi:hypothetical protein